MFDEVLRERDRRRRLASSLRDRLVAELHARVPGRQTTAERALLLRIKRNIHNLRPVASEDVSSLDEDLRHDVCVYDKAVREMANLLSSQREKIIDQVRGGIRDLVQDPRFRCAVEYACPWLIDSYERHSPPAARDFSNEERGLFSYAVKFFSKANPLHLFGTIGLPEATLTESHIYCEMVLDSSFILQIEQMLLPRSPAYRRYVYLRSFIQEENRSRFLVDLGGELRLTSLKNTPILLQLASILRTSSEPCSLGECEDQLADAMPLARRDEIRGYLAGLIRHGILAEYLVTDFRNFSKNLTGLDTAIDADLSALGQLHLAIIPEERLPTAQRRLSGITIGTVGKPGYFVNSYRDTESTPRPTMDDPVFGELAALKPFFGTLPNSMSRRDVIRRFMIDYLARRPDQRAPYLELLTEFLRNPAAIIERYSRSDPALDGIADGSWLDSLGSLQGEIEWPDIEGLLPEPRWQTARSICFNGPLDYRTGMFFPANIFAGEGRYVSRYFLHRSMRQYRSLPEGPEEWLDIQLVLPFRDNRLFVAALYPTGCGFESRYRHQFESWIDPSEIFVELRDGNVVYGHRPSQKLLRIHYVGFLLAEQVSPEYGLLLLEHADYFRNPFAVRARTYNLETSLGSLARVPKLVFGSICLRREEFRMPAGLVRRALEEEDPIAVTARFRDRLHEITGRQTDDWYFRAPTMNKSAMKPRYLDLGNVLSVHVLKREIWGVEKSSIISFSPMDPPVEHLFSQEQERFTTEVMIEV